MEKLLKFTKQGAMWYLCARRTGVAEFNHYDLTSYKERAAVFNSSDAGDVALEIDGEMGDGGDIEIVDAKTAEDILGFKKPAHRVHFKRLSFA